jgi:hypothetical protein
MIVVCLFSPKNQQTNNELKSNGAVVQAKKSKNGSFSRFVPVGLDFVK